MHAPADTPRTSARRATGGWRAAGAAALTIVFLLTLLGSVGAVRAVATTAGAPAASGSAGESAVVATGATAVEAGRVESIIELGRSAGSFVAPVTSRPVLRALPRSGFALWLLLLAALAALAAVVGLTPGHDSSRDSLAIAVRCGPARLPRRRGPPP